MSKAMRQMLEQSGRAGAARGETACDPVSDEACGPLLEHQGTGSAKSKAGTGDLLEAALTRQNLQAAWKQVKANKGAAGVDGLDIEQTAQVVRQRWPDIRQELLAGRYRPSPVRKVMIPKPDGSQRELGIPTVLDRLIQQALLQVLQPLIDPSFSEHSYGFRPGRRAHDAVKAARGSVHSYRSIRARAPNQVRGGALQRRDGRADDACEEITRRGPCALNPPSSCALCSRTLCARRIHRRGRCCRCLGLGGGRE